MLGPNGGKQTLKCMATDWWTHSVSAMHDTSPEADAVVIEGLRRLSPAERIARAMNLSAFTARLSKRAIANAHPDWSQQEREAFFVELHYGKELADGYRRYLESQCNRPT